MTKYELFYLLYALSVLSAQAPVPPCPGGLLRWDRGRGRYEAVDFSVESPPQKTGSRCKSENQSPPQTDPPHVELKAEQITAA